MNTPIERIGEIDLIEKIKKIVESEYGADELKYHLIKGISDDAAVFKNIPSKVQLFTSDSFVEGIHFDLTFTSMQHLGWKVIAATLSDIAAMGGSPQFVLINLCLTEKISVEMVEEFYRGAVRACKRFSCMIIGGDTTSSTGSVSITVSVLGTAMESKIIYRNGAKVKDLVCVTGHLGAAHAGLKILLREKKQYLEDSKNFKPNLEPYKIALEKYFVPVPRFDIIKIITDENIIVNSMIDLSYGLAKEIHKLCRQSGVGLELWEHNIPVESITQKIAQEFSENVVDYQLFGGEEYELLFTLNDREFEKLEKFTNDVTILGRIVEAEKGINFIRENGEIEPLPEKLKFLNR